MIKALADKEPKLGSDVFIAENAAVIGQVSIGDRCSIWYQSVIRGDVCEIEIGEESNIQDGAVIHGTYNKCGVKLARRVSVGHRCILHGCEVGEDTLIGMNCTVMDLAKIGKNCLIGAGSLVTEGTEIPDGMLAFGSPAKVVRPLNEKELEFVKKSADNYLLYKSWYTPTEENPQ